MKKNIFKILIVSVFVLGFSSFASAFELSPDNTILSTGINEKTFTGCTASWHYIYVYANNGENVDVGDCSTPMQLNISGNYNIVTGTTVTSLNIWETSQSMEGIMGPEWWTFTYQQQLNGINNWLIDNNSYTVTYPPPPTPVSTAGIFFPLDEQGETTASDLTASVGTATSTTVGGLTPIVVVVMGVLLAFIAIKTVISLVYDTKQSKK